MAGQIIKRGDGTWLVRIFTGRDSQGKRRYVNKTVKGKRKDAETYLSKTLTAISTGHYIEPSSLTLDAYFDKWLEAAAQPRLSPRTFSDYQHLRKLYVKPYIGQRRLSNLTPLDVQELYSKLLGRGLSSRTVHYTHCMLSSALKQAVRWRMLRDNPAADVELPRRTRKEMRAMTTDEAARFLRAAQGDRLGVLFAFALATGMRPSEYLGLQWKDVDFETGAVTVRRTLVRPRKGGGWSFGETKTPRSRRQIPLPSSILSALREHRRQQAETRLRLGSDYNNHDLVFTAGNGNPLHVTLLSGVYVKRVLRSAELPTSIRLYDLRHTCATLLLAANVHPKVVSERLGHATINLTLDLYSHVLPTMQQAASDELEERLFSKVGTQ